LTAGRDRRDFTDLSKYSYESPSSSVETANHSVHRPASSPELGSGSPDSPTYPPPPHGYNDHAASLAEQQTGLTKVDPAYIHPDLHGDEGYASFQNMMPASVAPQPDGGLPGPSGATLGGLGDVGADGRKAKRELSQSKRAAQNRAAQVSRPSLTCPSIYKPLCGVCSRTAVVSRKWLTRVVDGTPPRAAGAVV